MTRVFATYEAWRRALKRECPSVTFDGGRKGCRASGLWLGVKRAIGQWDGKQGVIDYRGI